MSKPKFIMLVGVPGSGKTSYTKNYILNHSNVSEYVILNTDSYIETVSDIRGQTYNEGFKDLYKMSNTLMNKQLDDALLNKKNIIWDQTNLTKKNKS